MDNTELLISQSALLHNLDVIRKAAGGVRILVNLKADAYGLGAALLGSFLDGRVDYFSVAQAGEGLRLREAGVRGPVMVYQPPVEPDEAFFRARLEPVLYDSGQVRHYDKVMTSLGLRDYPVHAKLDTGMRRSGADSSAHRRLAEAIYRAGSMRLVSVFSHLAAADDPAEDAFTRQQISTFREMLAIWHGLFPGVWAHLANTAAIFRFPEAHFQMVRPGISLYGFHTLTDPMPDLRPVVNWRARIVLVKRVRRGDTVGYNRRYRVEHDMDLAVVPVGYADGLRRKLGEAGIAFHREDCRLPVVGRISMDMTTVAVPGRCRLRRGDWVTVMDGRDVQEWARLLDTIPYEILTSLGRRIPRKWAP